MWRNPQLSVGYQTKLKKGALSCAMSFLLIHVAAFEVFFALREWMFTAALGMDTHPSLA